MVSGTEQCSLQRVLALHLASSLSVDFVSPETTPPSSSHGVQGQAPPGSCNEGGNDNSNDDVAMILWASGAHDKRC